MAALWYT